MLNQVFPPKIEMIFNIVEIFDMFFLRHDENTQRLAKVLQRILLHDFGAF